jgi:hypothetical protein
MKWPAPLDDAVVRFSAALSSAIHPFNLFVIPILDTKNRHLEVDVFSLLWQFPETGHRYSHVLITKGCFVKTSGYVVWVNDMSFWHRTQAGAQKRVFKAELRGQDVFIHALDQGPDNPRPVRPGGKRAA